MININYAKDKYTVDYKGQTHFFNDMDEALQFIKANLFELKKIENLNLLVKDYARKLLFDEKYFFLLVDKTVINSFICELFSKAITREFYEIDRHYFPNEFQAKELAKKEKKTVVAFGHGFLVV